MEKSVSPYRKQRLLLAWILVPAFLLHALTLRADHSWGGDFAQYITQAQSLVEGELPQMVETSRLRYELSDSKKIGPVLYPWGFPLLLAPVYRLFGLNMIAMKGWVDLFFFLGLVLVYRIFEGRTPRDHPLWIVMLLAYNPLFWDFKENVLSDIPFFGFSLLAVTLIQHYIIEEREPDHRLAGYSLIGLAIYLAFAIRTSGIVLLPTLLGAQVLAWLAHGKKNLRWGSLLPYLLFIILYMLTRRILPEETTYKDLLSLVTLRTVLGNGYYYARLLSEFFSFGFPNLGMAIYLASLPLTVSGLLADWRKNPLFLLFPACLLGLHLFWPSRQGLRFIFPLIPFYLHYLLTGLETFSKHFLKEGLGRRWNLTLTPGWVFTSALTLVFLLEILSAQFGTSYIAEGELPGPYQMESLELFTTIRQNTPQDSIVLFFKPRVMTLYTGRRSIATTNLVKVTGMSPLYIACRPEDDCESIIHQPSWDSDLLLENDQFSLYYLEEHP